MERTGAAGCSVRPQAYLESERIDESTHRDTLPASNRTVGDFDLNRRIESLYERIDQYTCVGLIMTEIIW